MPVMDDTLADWDARTRSRFRRGLIAWYRRNARPLPWRKSADPYRIWISEIMLQQTTVVAVIPYFERFLARFPTLADLAAANEEDVLRLWEGLGYYSRARNIHKAARLIARELGGRFPDEVAALLELPGIGRYTAGAIASFAFDRRAPIVEANTLRLYCRLLGYRGDPRSAAGQRLLWEFASHVVPHKGTGEFNQALMELGATLCAPENADCPECPVRHCCAAFANGWQQQIPIAAARPEITEVNEIAVAIQRSGRYLMRKRPTGERWAGLWDFVRFVADENGRASSSGVARSIRQRTGLAVENPERIAEIRHSVTRFRITLHCYTAEWMTGEPADGNGEFRWVTPGQLSKLPLSTTGRKLARLLTDKSRRHPRSNGVCSR
jgi:A/G-specific adenine glycosylase